MEKEEEEGGKETECLAEIVEAIVAIVLNDIFLLTTTGGFSSSVAR